MSRKRSSAVAPSSRIGICTVESGGLRKGRLRQVVYAHHRDVLRHGITHRLQSAHRAIGKTVARRQDGGEGEDFLADKTGDGLGAEFRQPVIDFEHQIGIGRQPMMLQGIAPALKAPLDGPPPRPQHEQDALMPGLDQPLGSDEGG